MFMCHFLYTLLPAGADFKNKLPTKHERFLFYLWVGKNKFEKFKI